MAINDLSPAFIKLYYTGPSGQHVMTIPTKYLDAPIPATKPTLMNHNEAGIDPETWIDDLMAVVRPLVRVEVEFQSAEFWSKPTPSDDPIYIHTYAIGLAGTSSATSNPANMGTMTFRTAGGGIAKCTVLDLAGAANLMNPYPFGASVLTNLATFITSFAGAWYGRDNTKPIVPIRWLTKTNDPLRKRVFNL